MNLFLHTHIYLSRDDSDLINHSNWHIFDDIDVSECKMDDDEELRSQCFGGDNPISSFDQSVMKRSISSYSFSFHLILYRQRRWWNAYILFYEKIPLDQSEPVNHFEEKLSQLQLCKLRRSFFNCFNAHLSR